MRIHVTCLRRHDHPERPGRRTAAWLSCALLLCAASSASGQTAPAPAAPAPTYTLTPIVRDWTRAEFWSYFDPPPSGGDPDYATVANRLLAGVRHRGPRHELTAAFQYVQFGGLPDDAIGPGPLGTGASYWDHNRHSDSRGFYLRLLTLDVKRVLPGVDVRGGRMSYTSGAEAASGDPAIESLKRMRLDSRLIGDFEWSLFQRSFDGVRVDWAPRPSLRATVSTLWPTQGGFDEHAGGSLRDVRVAGGTFDVAPSPSIRHTAVQGFVFDYRDTRPVTARPDNTLRPATAVDIHVATFGASAVGAYPARGARIDALAWLALQRGDWYDTTQRSSAIALEAGVQAPALAWRPWVRGGWNYASGDGNPADGRHGTFFPPLPTSRKYSLSATYAFMNLQDAFTQVILRPHPRLGTRADVHWVHLADSADLWYAGSGATRRTGTIFGYGGRRSGGATGLGTVVEGSVDITLTRRWSINAYAGAFRGGDVVRTSFARDRLGFAYLENVIQY
jgi:alginate export protein